jgi:hypothetical protein
MPCYCDTPSKLDQAEIERRCKVNMYFEATGILTKENIDKADNLGLKISQFPLPDPNTALCNICKILDEDQMKSIPAYYFNIEWNHKSLWDWYQKHLIDDEKHNSFIEGKECKSA